MINICSIDSFKKKTNNRPVILLGAGDMASRILMTYDWNIKCAVDNNPKLSGGVISIGDKSVGVYSWDYLYTFENKDCVLMITPMMASGLIEQVEDDEQLCECDIYVYHYMLAVQWDIDRILVSKKPFSMTKGTVNKIPKVIHYFWFSSDPYPEKVRKCIDSWKKYCPDYKFQKWDLTNYKTENVFCNEALSVRSWAHASDYGRCDVLRKYGGIYLDTDVELIKPIDDLLYDDGFFIFESSDGVDPGSGMGACQGNEILAEICNQYSDIHFINEDGSFNKVNIINQYTNVLRRHGLVSDGSYQLIDGIAVYPPLVMSPYSYNTGFTATYDNTYGIHHWVSAWISDEWKRELERKRSFISSRVHGVDELLLL